MKARKFWRAMGALCDYWGLQWGRADEGAEMGICLIFLEPMYAASMGPRR